MESVGDPKEAPLNKLLAEWFWIERWEGSRAAMLPMEAQGIYRAMLSHAWRRGASLPIDPEEIQLLIRCRLKEWKRSWPSVKPYWKEENGMLVNATQQEVYSEALAKKERAQARAQAGAQARHKKTLKYCPPSPSPSKRTTEEPPMPQPNGVPELETEGQAIWASHTGGTHDYLYRDLAPLSRERGVRATLDALDRYLTDEMQNEGGKFASSRAFAKNPNRWFTRISSGPRHRTMAEIKAEELKAAGL